MKALLSLILLSLCSFSYGQSNEISPNAEVLSAIRDSVESNDLNCRNAVTGEKFRASEISWDNLMGIQNITGSSSVEPRFTLTLEKDDILRGISVTTNEERTVVIDLTIKSEKLVTKRAIQDTNSRNLDVQEYEAFEVILCN